MSTTQQKIELNAQIRTAIGGRLNSLRKSGFMPAVLYGKNQQPIPLQIDIKNFNKIFKKVGESTLIYLNIDGKLYPTLIHDIAKDPIKGNILHADFYKVNLDQKVKSKIPVVFIGESPAVHNLGGIFVRNVNELEVEGFPQDLTHEIKIDISSLKNFGDQILVKDINLGDNIKIEANPETIIATVKEPISEEELKASLEVPTSSVEEVEVIKKEKRTEEDSESSNAS
jgi:large subunit ribosomal protein L25